MSTEENKTLVRRVQEGVWQAGNVALADELMADVFPLQDGTTREQWKAGVLDVRKQMPDFSFNIDEMIAEGDKVVSRWTMRGTHTSELDSPYGPMPPTGKTVTFTGITIQRVKDGKIVEDRFENSYFDFLQQIGAIPMPNQSSS